MHSVRSRWGGREMLDCEDNSPATVEQPARPQESPAAGQVRLALPFHLLYCHVYCTPPPYTDCRGSAQVGRPNK